MKTRDEIIEQTIAARRAAAHGEPGWQDRMIYADVMRRMYLSLQPEDKQEYEESVITLTVKRRLKE